MDWFGLGRPRTKFGEWMERNKITQEELARRSGVPRGTISDLARDKDRRPNWRTEKRLMQTLRQYDSEVSAEDFWG